MGCPSHPPAKDKQLSIALTNIVQQVMQGSIVHEPAAVHLLVEGSQANAVFRGYSKRNLGFR